MVIIIIIINFNWVITRWQWLFYMYTKHEISIILHQLHGLNGYRGTELPMYSKMYHKPVTHTTDTRYK